MKGPFGPPGGVRPKGGFGGVELMFPGIGLLAQIDTLASATIGAGSGSSLYELSGCLPSTPDNMGAKSETSELAQDGPNLDGTRQQCCPLNLTAADR